MLFAVVFQRRSVALCLEKVEVRDQLGIRRFFAPVVVTFVKSSPIFILPAFGLGLKIKICSLYFAVKIRGEMPGFFPDAFMSFFTLGLADLTEAIILQHRKH